MNVINHLSTLETAGLVRLAQVVPDLEYLFRHILVQDAVYASLLQVDQQRMHREVGEALEWLYPDRLDELAPTLARHYERAGENARALHFFQRAARTALESFANQEAEKHYRAALALKPEPVVLAELFGGLGESLYRQSQFLDAIQAWQQAIGAYRQLADQENVAHWYARSARAAWFQKESRRSLELCQEGMQVVSGAPAGPRIAELVHETARAYFFAGEREKVEPLCRQALGMAEQFNALDVQADTLSTLGLILESKSDEAIAFLTRSVELAEAAGLLDIAFRAHINLGSAVRNFRDDLEGCRQHFLRSAEVARRRGSLQEEIFALSAVAGLLLNIGDMEELEKLLVEIERLENGLPGGSQLPGQVEYMRAIILMTRGEYVEAAQMGRALRLEAIQHNDPLTRSEMSELLVSVLLEMYVLGLSSDLDEVETLAKEELAEPHTGKQADLNTWFVLVQCRVCVYRGNLAEAARLLEKARGGGFLEHATFKVLLAVAGLDLARAQGDLSEIWSMFDGIQENKSKIFLYYYGRSLMRWAEVGLERGEPEDLERAQAMLLEAIEIYRRMKNPLLLAKLDQLLHLSRDRTLAQAAAQKKVVQELVMAGKIQGSFLPEVPPNLAGWQTSVAYQPARQTSGDFYDFIPLPDGRMAVIISDVADKGMGAALYMASARSLLRAYAVEFPGQPVEVITRASLRLTSDTHGGLFVTLFYGVLNPQTGEMVYVNAGHNPPYLFRPGIEPLALTKTGIPLGVFDDVAWVEGCVTLTPGSLLVMYTDGVTEAINQAEEPFGEERLIAAVNGCQPEPGPVEDLRAARVRDCILGDILSHRGSTPQMDDITMLVISRL